MKIIKPEWHWREDPAVDPLNLASVDSIALHHMDHSTAGIWDIERWHLARAGYKGFAYNYWVGFDGAVYEGRGLNEGAGVLNENGHIISIGFQGGCEPSDKFQCNTQMPEEQFNAGVELIKYLRGIIPSITTVAGHKHWSGTVCPGRYFPLEKMIKEATGVIFMDLLKRGSTGTDVSNLQEKLNQIGYALAIDGDFGPATEAAVKDFQAKYGLLVDGIAGERTMAKLIEASRQIQQPAIDYKAKYEELVIKVKALAEELL